MRKLLLILSFVFLNYTWGSAQNTITKTEFEHLVDYVNSQNVRTFIKKYDENKPGYFQTYQKNVEPKLQAASLDNLEKVLSYDNLYKLLKDNTPAQNLAKKINELKNKYDENLDNITLINFLSITSWNNIDLSENSNTLQNSLLAKYNPIDKNSNNSNTISKTEEVKSPELQNSTTIENPTQSDIPENQINNFENEKKFLELQKSVNRIFWIQIIVTFMFIGICVFLLVNYERQFNPNNDNSKLKKFVKNLVLNSVEINEKFVIKNDPKFGNVNNSRSQSYFLSEKDLNLIVDSVIECIRLTEEEKSHQSKLINGPNAIENRQIEKYFKTKNGKILQEELPNSGGSSFRVYNINNNEAIFEYCGEIVNTDFFDSVCIFQNNPLEVPNKKKILTTSPGKVKKDNTGNWVVESPATIKFT